MTPDNSLNTKEKEDLEFEVLSDEGNDLAQKLGLVFALDEALRPIYTSFGIDIVGDNGDETWELPIPATYVIDADGKVVYRFADADYTKRAEPSEVIAKL